MQADLRHPLRLIHSVTLSTAVLMIHDGFEEARRTGKALISAGQKGLNYSAAERDKDTFWERMHLHRISRRSFLPSCPWISLQVGVLWVETLTNLVHKQSRSVYTESTLIKSIRSKRTIFFIWSTMTVSETLCVVRTCENKQCEKTIERRANVKQSRCCTHVWGMKAKGVKWSRLRVRLFLEALQTTAETPQQKTHPKFLISMKKTCSVLLFYFDKNIYILENSKQHVHMRCMLRLR